MTITARPNNKKFAQRFQLQHSTGNDALRLSVIVI